MSEPTIHLGSKVISYLALKPHIKEIIEHLWSFLENEKLTQKTVSLLSDFNKMTPRTFSDVITKDLDSKEQDKAINRFSKFWKLTKGTGTTFD